MKLYCECGKIVRMGRNDCHTCKGRKYDKKYPLKRFFRNLKSSAKRRNIKFTITFEYFLSVIPYSFSIDKGRFKNNSTIDRIDNEKGYEIGNIQVMSKSKNSKKYHYQKLINDNLPF